MAISLSYKDLKWDKSSEYLTVFMTFQKVHYEDCCGACCDCMFVCVCVHTDCVGSFEGMFIRLKLCTSAIFPGLYNTCVFVCVSVSISG